MPMGTVAPVWRQQFCDPAGHPFANGTIEVFVAGTVAHAVVYQDQTVTVPHPWPIPLNAAGMTSEAMFLLPGSYHFYVKDAAGVVQWDDDLVSSVPSASLDVDTPAVFGESVTYGTVVYDSIGLGGKTPGLWYKTSATNDWSSSAATVVGLATADFAAGASGSVRLVGRMTKLTGLVVGTVYYASTTPGVMTNVKPATNILQIGIPDSTSSILLAIVVAGQFQMWTPSGGVATVVGQLHVGGDAVFSGALAVSGATSLQGVTATSLTVNGPTNLGATGVTGNLGVTGALTVGGAITAASLSVTGSVGVNGNLQTQGVIFPGRIDIGGGQTQGSWWLGSHPTYGLYSNTGLYLASALTVAGAASVAGGMTVGGLTVTNTVNAGGYLCRAGIGGATANVFNINWNGTVQMWIDSSNVGTIQMQGNLPSSPRFNVRAANSAVTAVVGDFILIDSGSFTVTLPAVVQGGIIDIKMYGAGPVTVAASGGVYLDYPATTYLLSVPNQSVTVVGANGNWWVR
jgi:hypothetical protein